MSLWYPPPLGGAQEANRLTTLVDSQLNFPLGCCDSKGAPTLPSPGVCRGHLDLLDTEEGRAQVTWQPGQDAYFQLSDHTYTASAPGSTHFGGSCQVGFSTDRGISWKVAASYHGNCPHRGENDVQTFEFKVPINMPQGPAIFGWIWLNREHESFMNCASVQIGKNSSISTFSTQSKRTSKISLASRSAPLAKSTDSFQEEKTTRKSTIRRLEPTSTLLNWSVLEPTHVRHQHRKKHYKYYYVRSVEKRRMHQHHNKSQRKRALEGCDWTSAPTMETSYYTTDANCAANAKSSKPESDSFEIGWSNACGVVKGDGEYPIKDIKC
jgi:hypothetical protein